MSATYQFLNTKASFIKKNPAKRSFTGFKYLFDTCKSISQRRIKKLTITSSLLIHAVFLLQQVLNNKPLYLPKQHWYQTSVFSVLY